MTLSIHDRLRQIEVRLAEIRIQRELLEQFIAEPERLWWVPWLMRNG